jgi:hypothetical protein
LARGSYLNIGEQHLWGGREYVVFERPERPAGPAALVRYEDNDEDFGAAMRHLAVLAATSVRRRRAEHGEGRAAMQRLGGSDDPLNPAVASALLGNADRARHLFAGVADKVSAELLAALDRNHFEEYVKRMIESARSALRLPEADWSWGA